MGNKRPRWLAASEWQQIVVVTPTGKVEQLRPDTPVYFITKKETFTRTVQQLLEDLFQMSVNAQIEDPWDYAVKCISSLAVVKQMKIYSPKTHKLIGKASLVPPRKLMH